jgi:hypothetical protein
MLNTQADYYDEGGQRFYYNGGDGEEDEQQAPNCMTWGSFFSMLLFLFCAFFTILVIYSLVAFNTDEAKSACSELYPYMITRTVLGFCMFVALSLYSFYLHQDVHNTSLLVFSLVYFLTLAIYGGVVVSKNMVSNEACTNAIFDKTFQTALLGNLGWVYVVSDVLYGFCTLLMLLNSQFQQQEG